MEVELTDQDIITLEYLPRDMWPEHLEGLPARIPGAPVLMTKEDRVIWGEGLLAEQDEMRADMYGEGVMYSESDTQAERLGFGER